MIYAIVGLQTKMQTLFNGFTALFDVKSSCQIVIKHVTFNSLLSKNRVSNSSVSNVLTFFSSVTLLFNNVANHKT